MNRKKIAQELRELLRQLTWKKSLIALFSSAFLAFGLYHVHSFSGVTEGGVLGMTLLLDHWFGISPSVSGAILNVLCFALGWRLLGSPFIAYSLIATAGFSGAYRLCECFPPLWPDLGEYPLAAALLGAVFVGLGAGLCVRAGGATGGDDALAMGLSQLLHWKIERVYLLTDLTVLALSATYIPWQRLIFSLLTVVCSGQIVGLVQRFPNFRTKKIPPDSKAAADGNED